MNVDHISICVDAPDELARILTEFGLTEGQPNAHKGQGTAARRFFFHDFYLELVYLTHLNNPPSTVVKNTNFKQRIVSEQQTPSPFAVIFKPSDVDFNPNDHPSWDYQLQYLPPDYKITVFNTPVCDPIFFYMGFLINSSGLTFKKHTDAAGFEKTSSIVMIEPKSTENSKLKHDLNELNILNIEQKDEYLLEITFDDGVKNNIHDFRPALPLIFKW